jgi:hypothetical protein
VPTTGRNSHERTGRESSGKRGASCAIAGTRLPPLIRRKIVNFRMSVLKAGLTFSPVTGIRASELANLSSELLK